MNDYCTVECESVSFSTTESIADHLWLLLFVPVNVQSCYLMQRKVLIVLYIVHCYFLSGARHPSLEEEAAAAVDMVAEAVGDMVEVGVTVEVGDTAEAGDTVEAVEVADMTTEVAVAVVAMVTEEVVVVADTTTGEGVEVVAMVTEVAMKTEVEVDMTTGMKYDLMFMNLDFFINTDCLLLAV